MPHYSDGTEAKVGDHVEGKGYNVPHPIQGILVGITPGQDSCNVRVAHLRQLDVTGGHGHLTLCGGFPGDPTIFVQAQIEYGQADAFRLVHRPERAS